MQRSLLSAALLLAALTADARDARTVALYLVLAAIPAGAWAALAYFGDLVDGSAAEDTGALHVGLSALALLLVVLAAAVRAQALEGSAVPALGASALVGALALVALQLAVAIAANASRERITAALKIARN
jgi:hypothetical protein